MHQRDVGARAALAGAGAALAPVPVDAEGLDVAVGEQLHPTARAAFVTPSYQFPLGVTMSLPRRLALLDWARRAGAWVIEDDYDSEFRYATRPLACLQGLDTADRVLYVGTFSKTLFPALRLGYLVVPPALVDAVIRARAVLDRPPPTVDQAVLADFIADGHFARHVRRMRALYAERQGALLAAARDALAGVLDVRPADAGMHLVGWLAPGVPDDAASRAALAAGVEAPPLSRYAIRPTRRGALLLGYAAFPPAVIRSASERLGEALRGS
jgi:GntR family transcriptional regulator/MocR family aminotransferase